MSGNGEKDPKKTTDPGAPAKWLLPIAVILLTLYVVVLVWLFFTADDKDASETIWGRYVFLLGGLEAIVFTAVGWLFGREVNRKQAEQAETAQDEAKQATATAKGLKTAILTHPSIAGTGQEMPAGADAFQALRAEARNAPY